MSHGASLLAFGFVSPWLLAGGLALSAVPLVIHLLRRRNHVDRPWAAMQFLQAALRSQARRVRLESLALLLVRTVLIALAAAAIAQPYFDEEEARRDSPVGRERLLVIDTSLSMNAGPRTGTALDRARALAARIVETAPASDSFRLLQIRRTPPLTIIQQPATDRPAILQQIRALEGTQQSADVPAALKAVLSCLQQAPGAARREVVMISDFQASNWLPAATPSRTELSELLSEIADQSELTCLHISAKSSNNLSLAAVTPVTGPPPETAIRSVEVSVQNSGAQPAPDVPVEVFSGQQRVGRALVSVPAGETATVQVALVEMSPVERTLLTQIPDDELADDNRHWLILPERTPLHVLLVSGRARADGQRGAADFVQLVLAPGSASSTPGVLATTIDAVDFGNTDLSRYSCIFLCNVAGVDATDAVRLHDYVKAGGGLVIALGDLAQSSGYRALAQAEDDPIMPQLPLEVAGSDRTTEGPVRFAPGDYAHPVIRPFAGNPESGLLTTEIDRYWRLNPPSDVAANVALSFSTGDPAIIERRVGDGHVLLVTTPLDDTWSNWALWPSFVPIVHELTRSATAGRTASHAKLVGDPLMLSLTAENFGQSVELRTPAGAVSELRKAARPDGSWTATATTDTAGVYVISFGTPMQSLQPFAVNVSPEEGRLQFLDGDALAQLVPDSAFRSLEDWQPVVLRALRSSQRSRMSRMLLIVVLGLLLVDQLMTWKFRVGLAALALLIGAASAASLGGHSGVMTALIALSLLGALVMTMFVRSRAARGTVPGRIPERLGADRF